jgi:flagellar hook-basal body complex protein FliE
MNIAPIKPPMFPELSSSTGTTGIGGASGTGVEHASGKVDLAQSFGDILRDAHAAENTATDAATQFARGDTGMGIHEVMIASEKANLEIRYVTTLKNKALEAYRELLNTQV